MNSENEFASVLNGLAEKIEKAKLAKVPSIQSSLYDFNNFAEEEDSSSSSEDEGWEDNNAVYTNAAINYTMPTLTYGSSSSSSVATSSSSSLESESSTSSNEGEGGLDDAKAGLKMNDGLKIHCSSFGNSPVTFEINNLKNKILWFTVGNNQVISQEILDDVAGELKELFEPHGAKVFVSDASLNLKGVFKFNTNNNKNDKGEKLKVF